MKWVRAKFYGKPTDPAAPAIEYDGYTAGDFGIARGKKGQWYKVVQLSTGVSIVPYSLHLSKLVDAKLFAEMVEKVGVSKAAILVIVETWRNR